MWLTTEQREDINFQVQNCDALHTKNKQLLTSSGVGLNMETAPVQRGQARVRSNVHVGLGWFLDGCWQWPLAL